MARLFTVEGSQLRKAVAFAADLLGSNRHIPILENLLITAEWDGITLMASDMDRWITLTVPGQVEEPFSTTVNGSLLSGILASIAPGSQATLEVTEEGAVLKAGRARFKLPTLLPDTYPPQPGFTPIISLEIASSVAFASAMAAVEHVKAEEHKYNMCGIHMRPADTALEFGAYDGKRLSTAQLATGEIPDFEGFTLPYGSASRVKRLCEDEDQSLTIEASVGMGRFKGKGWTFLTKLLDGEFPKYWTVKLALSDEPILFDPAEMSAALARAALVLDKSITCVRLSLDRDQLSFAMKNPSMGTVTEDVPVGYSGEPAQVGYNLRFLRDALRNCPGDEAEFHIDAQQRAIVFSRSPNSPRHMIANMAI